MSSIFRRRDKDGLYWWYAMYDTHDFGSVCKKFKVKKNAQEWIRKGDEESGKIKWFRNHVEKRSTNKAHCFK